MVQSGALREKMFSSHRPGDLVVQQEPEGWAGAGGILASAPSALQVQRRPDDMPRSQAQEYAVSAETSDLQSRLG
jgi:hypothetical protein